MADRSIWGGGCGGGGEQAQREQVAAGRAQLRRAVGARRAPHDPRHAQVQPPPQLPADLDVPDSVRQAVEQQLAQQVEGIRAALEAQYAGRAAQNEAKLKSLEASIGK